MTRRVLISFLGTTPYLDCCYYLEQDGPNGAVVKYVQEALLRDVCKGWGGEDAFLVLTTQMAEKTNWVDSAGKDESGQPVISKGLKGRLLAQNHMLLPENIRHVPIMDGLQAEEIWGIFEAVYAELRGGDEVYFDVTNSFRFLPMLGLVLLNYAGFMKQVSIEAIYYGAFEKLGTLRQVTVDIPNPYDRHVPILDLKGLVELQRWSQVANEFVNLGMMDTFREVHTEKLLSEKLEELVKSIRTSRGVNLLYDFDYEQLSRLIAEAKARPSVNQPQMRRLLGRIEEQVKDFRNQEVQNGFGAVEWCIRYGLVPQGYTLLQETVKTWLVGKVATSPNDVLNYKGFRAFTDIALNNVPKYDEKGRFAWRGVKEYQKEVIALIERMIGEVAKVPGLVGVYKRLTGDLRNDINHGGFRRPYNSPDDLTNELKAIYQEIKELRLFD